MNDYDQYEEIKCPHCENNANIEPEDMDKLITYHAESGPIEWICNGCDKKFYILEHINRYWEVANDKELF